MMLMNFHHDANTCLVRVHNNSGKRREYGHFLFLFGEKRIWTCLDYGNEKNMHRLKNLGEILF